MTELSIVKCAEQLAAFFYSKSFEPVTQRTPYHHMGATITDAVLQAGMNYENVVYPRILNLLKNFPEYSSTCDFIILMQIIPLENLINWKNNKKNNLIKELAWLFFNNKVENEDQLADWLEKKENIEFLIDMNGIGPKTIDYLKMLSGKQTIAIDRHLFSFLKMAGIIVQSYQEASQIYCKTAELLKISKYEIDKKIWKYMSKTEI